MMLFNWIGKRISTNQQTQAPLSKIFPHFWLGNCQNRFLDIPEKRSTNAHFKKTNQEKKGTKSLCERVTRRDIIIPAPADM
jgi:hypothetical protein